MALQVGGILRAGFSNFLEQVIKPGAALVTPLSPNGLWKDAVRLSKAYTKEVTPSELFLVGDVQFKRELNEQMQKDQLEGRNVPFLSVYSDATAHGFASVMHTHSHSMFIKQFIIDQKHREAGQGLLFIAELQEWGRKNNLPECHLVVPQHLPSAQNFAREAGFSPTIGDVWSKRL